MKLTSLPAHPAATKKSSSCSSAAGASGASGMLVAIGMMNARCCRVAAVAAADASSGGGSGSVASSCRAASFGDDGGDGLCCCTCTGAAALLPAANKLACQPVTRNLTMLARPTVVCEEDLETLPAADEPVFAAGLRAAVDAEGLLCGCLPVGAVCSFRIFCNSAARRPGGRCALGGSAFCAAAAPLCRRHKALSAMRSVCRV